MSEERARDSKRPRVSASPSPTPRSVFELLNPLSLRIRWDSTTPVPLEEWLDLALPSKVSRAVAAWIQVDNPTTVRDSSPGDDARTGSSCTFDRAPYEAALGQIDACIAASGRVPKAAKEACVQSLIAHAKAQRYTCGKWMLFFPPGEATDDAWTTIARETAAGRLGSSAKIAPTRNLDDGEKSVCCVYVGDFGDKAEVRRVLLALQALGMNVTSGFKPDVFTELELNTGNRWRLEPTLYKVAEVVGWTTADHVAPAGAIPKVRASPWG